ncbi:MAG TPA: acylphosphatase [Bdellovibrionota bacterium]|nr:acylphosphatase [Bdellovibrionota bacterium]
MKRLHLIIRGQVQGVYFRAHTQETAASLGLTGWVRNCPDGTVEVVAEGEERELNKLLEWSYIGPPRAKVTKIDSRWETATGEFREFDIKY